MNRNPQNLKPEQIGNGFRLLTDTEAVFIESDPENGREFARFLQLEFYSFSACLWSSFDPDKGKISPSLSYRTHEAEGILESFPAIMAANNFGDYCLAFVASFNVLANEHYQRMIAKGFWDGESRVLELAGQNQELREIIINAFDGQKLALQTSEVSEALEGFRHGNPPDDKIPEFLSSEAELADVILRLMDHAARRGWRVAEALVAKMQMNATREKKHGKSF